jgi:hypothetical protein
MVALIEERERGSLTAVVGFEHLRRLFGHGAGMKCAKAKGWVRCLKYPVSPQRFDTPYRGGLSNLLLGKSD